MLLVGVPGKEVDAETAERLRRLQPGGFILFGRNIESAGQLRKLVDDLRDLSAVEPVVTIDQEGGRVSRLRLIGHEPPSAQQLRYNGDRDLIEWHGRLTGKLLRLFGINLDLCPVLGVLDVVMARGVGRVGGRWWRWRCGWARRCWGLRDSGRWSDGRCGAAFYSDAI